MRAHVVVYGATPAGIVAAALAARAETPVQAVGYEDLRAALAKQGQRVLKAPPPQP